MLTYVSADGPYRYSYARCSPYSETRRFESYQILIFSRFFCLSVSYFINIESKSFHRSIPGLKQRIAGKSLPVEKFAVKKSTRFFAQGERLTLAGLELIYAWNGYRILGKQYECVDRFYALAEEERRRLENIPEHGQNFTLKFLTRSVKPFITHD